MTLFIACLLIHGFDMSGAWYIPAVIIWIMHLFWNVAIKE